MRPALFLSSLCALLATVTSAPAQTADARAQAERLFEQGLRDVKREAWSDALGEFLQSMDRLPTRSAATNVAVCLEKLGRFDEALDAYDDLLRRFPNLTEDERATIVRERSRIERFLGAIAIEGGIAGARVTIDGRARGATPLEEPLRASVGTRVVRMAKAGFAPFETTVRVASGETTRVSAHLAMVTQLGRLRVTEEEGRGLEVRIDGAPVGTTPWEGTVAKGEHVVALRGPNDTGSPPSAVGVDAESTTEVTLRAGVLPAELRVEPSPADARIAIDGKVVSRGTWTGTVPSGEHAVDIDAPWHEPAHTRIAASSATPQTLRPSLERIRRLYAEMYVGQTLQSFYGVSGPGDCSAECTASYLGVRGGWVVAPRIGIEIFVDNTNAYRDSRVYVPAIGTSEVYVTRVNLNGGGVSARYQWFDRTPLTLRVFGGLMRGYYYASGFDQGHAVSANVWGPVAGPEIRFGYRFGRALVVDASAAAIVFTVPALPPSPIEYVDVPQSPGFTGGLGVTFPASVGLHLDF